MPSRYCPGVSPRLSVLISIPYAFKVLSRCFTKVVSFKSLYHMPSRYCPGVLPRFVCTYFHCQFLSPYRMPSRYCPGVSPRFSVLISIPYAFQVMSGCFTKVVSALIYIPYALQVLSGCFTNSYKVFSSYLNTIFLCTYCLGVSPIATKFPALLLFLPVHRCRR